VSLIGDGSIGSIPPGHFGQEVRILTDEVNYEDRINAVTEKLKALKAQVNSTCGLHVHIDMRGATPEEIQKRFINLVRSQKFLQSLVMENRRTNRYCEPIRRAMQYGEMRNRYFAINTTALSRHGTIEIRLHHATLEAHEIINWIKLLLKIVDGPAIKRTPKDLDHLAERLQLPAELKAYIVQTSAKYLAPSPSTLPQDDATIQTASPTCHEEHPCEVCLRCGEVWDSHAGHGCNANRHPIGQRGVWATCLQRSVIAPARAVVVECSLDHDGETCGECGRDWGTHDNHACYSSETDEPTGDIGRFDGCINTRQSVAQPARPF